MKKKILIYLDSDLFIRNYFTYNSFDLPEYDVVYYANDNIAQRYILENLKNFKGYLKVDSRRNRLRNLQSEIQMFKFINLSKSFKFRFNRFNPSIINKTILKIASINFFSRLFNFFIEARLQENKTIKNILQKEKPDLVIMPSQIIGSISHDLLDISKKLSIKTLCLIDGWDNISSKTVFPIKPSYLAVWGQQSVDHAVKIQNFDKNKIFIIGTPRFESYYDTSHINKSPYNFKYILFTGCALPFDEITTLKTLDYYLKQNNINDIKIVYRPHPWQQKRKCFDYFIEEDYKNVIIDKQIKDYYYCSKIIGLTNAIQPSLNYYPDLLKNCLFMISPLTTMIIEGAIMGKYVLTLAYDDGIHFENPKNALNSYEHFERVEKISAFKFCYEIKDLQKIFANFIDKVNEANSKVDFQNEIKYFIDTSKVKYSKKLEDIIKKILTNN